MEYSAELPSLELLMDILGDDPEIYLQHLSPLAKEQILEVLAEVDENWTITRDGKTFTVKELKDLAGKTF